MDLATSKRSETIVESRTPGIWKKEDDLIILDYIYQKISSDSKILWPKLAAEFTDQ